MIGGAIELGGRADRAYDCEGHQSPCPRLEEMIVHCFAMMMMHSVFINVRLTPAKIGGMRGD
jgi:hypothetical protein